MPAAQPSSRPQALFGEILRILDANGIDRERDPLVVVGIRGYYLDSMGTKGFNDRGMYDDACFVVTLDTMRSFNFNMDASSYRKGWGFGKEKGMAMLATGVWRYTAGVHKTYRAFRQAGPVTVLRDGNKGSYKDTGWFGINLHRGGVSGTSSAGCQTWPADQFDEAKNFIYDHLKIYSSKDYPFDDFAYIVIDESERRKGNLKVA